MADIGASVLARLKNKAAIENQVFALNWFANKQQWKSNADRAQQ